MPEATDRVTFEGRRTTRRSVKMLQEARRIFEGRTGRKAPRISQGGYNGGRVAASAGTHDGDAFDFATAGWPASLQRAWEDAMWTVGFADWWRRFLWNTWPEHHHAIPKGGDLSAGAAAQERAFRNRRDGLRGNRPYPRIGGYASRTWESYQRSKKGRQVKIGAKWYADLTSVSLYHLRNAWADKTPGVSRNVWYVQLWLRDLGYYRAAVDGICGPKTRAAYDAFRTKTLGLKGADATGAPGWWSLRELARRAKTRKKPVREGK